MSTAAHHRPTILFGLGATKAGTSWLHDYLRSHPEVSMPVTKELHYFDARAFDRVPEELARLGLLRARLARRVAAGGAGCEGLAARIEEIDSYCRLLESPADEENFRDFLLDRGQGARIVGDITPAYALLPEPMLARIQVSFAPVRFLYILRDPLDRLWSNIRMNAWRRARRADQVGRLALNMLDRWLAGGEDKVAVRSDYAGALGRMLKSLRPENLSVLFYERLFAPEAIDGLCRFLGLTPHPADFAQRVHASVPVPLDPARAARARAALRPQYDYVGQLMGDLPPRWRENMDE